MKKKPPRFKRAFALLCLAAAAAHFRGAVVTAAKASASPGSAPLVVIDSTGKTVGPLETNSVPFVVGGQVTTVALNGNTWWEGYLLYESTDCSGPAFILVLNSEPLLLPSAVGPPGDTVYVSDGSPPQSRTFNSSFGEVFGANGTGSAQCTSFTKAQQSSSWSTMAVANLDNLFKPPFSLMASQDVTTLK